MTGKQKRSQSGNDNQEASALDEDVTMLTVGMDLPFAQKRWCGAAGVDRISMLSDHRDASFGAAYGTLIKELRLESRAIFVLDRNDILQHVEYVREITNHPDYEAALLAAQKAVRG